MPFRNNLQHKPNASCAPSPYENRLGALVFRQR
jgi:hypothetical protein